MKINFIDQFPLQEAVNLYIDTKIWKIGGKEPSKHPILLVDYMIQKMVPFINACPLDKQAEARFFFESKIKEIAQRNVQFPIKNFNEQELTARIRHKLQQCYPNLVHHQTPPSRGFNVDRWEGNGSWIEASWKIKKTKCGSPKLCVETLKAHLASQRQGTAIRFLKIVVDELQKEGDPNALIRLKAWTGYSTLMGAAQGAYVWSRLGFNVCDYDREKRKEREEDGISLSRIPLLLQIKEKLLSKLEEDPLSLNRYFDTLAEQENKVFDSVKFIHEYSRLRLIAQERLKTCKYPWEIAELTIEGYPFGKYLTTQCDDSRFRAVLYPNLSNSPGMQQYYKRVNQFSI